MYLTFKEAAKGATKEIDVVEASGSTRSPRVEKKRYSVSIPAGIEDGQTLRISLSGVQVGNIYFYAAGKTSNETLHLI